MAGGGGLSQDDFRKLLATPRPGAAVDREATPARQKVAHTSKEKSSGSSGFAKPDVPARAKKRWKKPVNEQEAEPKYRDRASERRTGINPDYAESEQILATLQKTAEEQNQSVAYEQSKYLGGDVEYTHLVKGLDFALLNKVKAQLEKKAASEAAAVGDAAPSEQTQAAQQRDVRDEDLEAAAAEAAARAKAGEEKSVCAAVNADASGRPEFRSKFAERVFEAGMAAEHRKVAARNELFRPGRMAFNFELADELGGYRDAFAIPTTLVRSKTDPKVLKHSSAQLPGGNEFVLDKVLQVVSQARAPVAARAETSEKRAGVGKRKGPFATKVEKERPKELIVGMADDEDLFEGAGRDYVEGDGIEEGEREEAPGGVEVPTESGADWDVQAPECPANDHVSDAAVPPASDDANASLAPMEGPQRAPEDYDVDDEFAPQRPPDDFDVEAAFSEPAATAEPAPPAKVPAQLVRRTNYFGEAATAVGYLDEGDGQEPEDAAARKKMVTSVLRTADAKKGAADEPASTAARKPAEKFGVTAGCDAYEGDYSSFGLGITRQLSFLSTPPSTSAAKRGAGQQGESESKKPRRDRTKDKFNREFQAIDRIMASKYGAGLREDKKKGGQDVKAGPNRRERRAAAASGEKT